VWSYDEKGQLVTQDQAYDQGANGTIDTRQVYTYTYDAQGNTIFFLTHDAGYDSSVESTYDAQGRLIHSVSRYDEASPVALTRRVSWTSPTMRAETT
jgi:hypothetical protein